MKHTICSGLKWFKVWRRRRKQIVIDAQINVDWKQMFSYTKIIIVVQKWAKEWITNEEEGNDAGRIITGWICGKHGELMKKKTLMRF